MFSCLYFGTYLNLGHSCPYKMGDNGTSVSHRVSKENYIKGYEMDGQSSKGGGLYIQGKKLSQQGNDCLTEAWERDRYSADSTGCFPLCHSLIDLPCNFGLFSPLRSFRE